MREIEVGEVVKDCVQVLIVNKLTKAAEVTYLKGAMCIDGMGAKELIYISCPGHHRRTDDLVIEGQMMIDGDVSRNQIPDIDPENK